MQPNRPVKSIDRTVNIQSQFDFLCWSCPVLILKFSSFQACTRSVLRRLELKCKRGHKLESSICVSLNSKPDHPPGNHQGHFLNGQNPHSRRTKKVRNPDPWGRKVVLKPHPRGNYFQNLAKATQHETEIMKSSTEKLICLEILKQ